MLSRILDEVHLGGGLERPSPWYEYLSEPEKHNVTLKKASEVDELSDYELKVSRQNRDALNGLSASSHASKGVLPILACTPCAAKVRRVD